MTVHRVGEKAENQRKTREKSKVAETQVFWLDFCAKKKDCAYTLRKKSSTTCEKAFITSRLQLIQQLQSRRRRRPSKVVGKAGAAVSEIEETYTTSWDVVHGSNASYTRMAPLPQADAAIGIYRQQEAAQRLLWISPWFFVGFLLSPPPFECTVVSKKTKLSCFGGFFSLDIKSKQLLGFPGVVYMLK
jgi:hypothetical protein